MPMIEISEKDILRSKIITPGWYRVRIDSVGQKPATSGKSINFPVEGTVLFNADDGSEEFTNCPTPGGWMFNSEALGFAIEYVKAHGVEVKPGMRLELKHTEGKEIDVMIENGEWQGRTVNRINHKYRPVDKERIGK